MVSRLLSAHFRLGREGTHDDCRQELQVGVLPLLGLLVSQKLLPTVSSPQALRLLQLRAQTKTTLKPLPSVRTDLHGCSRIANIPVRFQVTELERRMVEASPAVCIDPSQPLDIGRTGGSVGSGGLGAVAGGQSTWGTAPPSRLTHGTLTTPAQPRNLRSVDILPSSPSHPSVRSDPTKPVKADPRPTCRISRLQSLLSTDFFKMQFPE